MIRDSLLLPTKSSFDVKTLFTNVPLQRTINIVLDRLYYNRLIRTQL